MKRLFFLASLVSLACMSCKSKKEATKTNDTSAAATTATTPDAPKTYRLIVSFISKGAGTDQKRTPFLAYVDGHPLKPAYKTVRWGREGETDYCFTLSELTAKKDLVAFIEEVRKITAGSDLININENAECQHAGR